MAITEPDVGLLTSSAQIFASNHTLPQIRAIHKSLHVQVDDKATRLRTQVGGSYRELLGTAETIVQMRGDMEGAQATLAGMGGRCGRAVVGGKVTALATFVEHQHEQSAALSMAARARLLEACSRTVGRLLSRTNPDFGTQATAKASSKAQTASARQRHGHVLRQQQQQQQQQSWGERLILASKVLVLSRLLLSSIGDTTPTPPRTPQFKLRPAAVEDAAVLASIEASKKSLGSLRRRLRDIIEVIERSVPTSASSDKSEAGGADEDDDDNESIDGERNHRGGDSNDDDNGTRAGQHDRSRATSAAATARDDLLRALCAHSLATTSGARDVLWQLLHVRSQAMALAFELDDEEHQHRHAQEDQPLDCRASWKSDNVLRGLALYTKTLLDVQALLPHRLPEALLGLKRRALLDDEALGQIDGLCLDVYARWCGDDVQYFKPYIRHDDLDAVQARDMLAKWAERGSEVLLAGLQRALEQQQKPAPSSARASAREQQPPVIRRHLDLNAIVDLRTRVLQLWIRDSSKARGFDPSELLDKMRAVFNQQMLQVLTTKVGKLRLVGSEVAAALASWQDGISDTHAQLWGGSGSSIDTDLADGAVPFVRDVIARLHGRSDAVAKAVASYVTWRHVVDDVTAAVEQLRRQRWDIDIDDIVEDEDTIAQRQQMLSRDDPQTLHRRLEEALEAAFQELNTHIAAEWATVMSSSSISATTKSNIAMYLVRVLREIRSRRPATSSSSAAMNQLGLQIIPELHAAIARAVAAQPVQQFASKVLTRKTVAGRPLWDVAGQQDTALPSSPSPGVFRFLRDLSTSMGDAGMDLWSATAVARLKQQVAEQLSEHWTKVLETADYLQEPAKELVKQANSTKETEANGDADKEEEEEKEANDSNEDGEENGGPATPAASSLTEDQRLDLLRQWLFDIAWLRCSFSGNDAAGKAEGMAELEDAVFKRTSLATDQDASNSSGKTPRQRVTKAAQEYWKKSALLFGLLA
ncbi:hypothetical protein SCUCBS95973_004335 [Sporothrix curviconia]|uniref:Conserved oligomeric Golgi complex subunit 1 n=1 Tax=Sporothrix curviconia TaxID=1260050 RepID=A0ABP0BMN8_9PEZI